MNLQLRETKARIHRWLVLAQMISPLAAVLVSAKFGIGWEFFAAIGGTVLLMVTSISLQIWWQIQDERRKFADSWAGW